MSPNKKKDPFCADTLGLGLAELGAIARNGNWCDFNAAEGLNLPCPPPSTIALHVLIDRKVLCEIACCCKEHPNISSRGANLYQNCVDETIKESNKPLADMDAPLGGLYRSEKSFRGSTPTSTPKDQRPEKYFDKVLSRVDVAAMIDPDNPSMDPSNIYKIYEMKFGNDPVDNEQLDKYKEIAQTNLIKVDKECDCKNEGKKILEAVQEYARSYDQQESQEAGATLLGILGTLLGLGPAGKAIPEVAPLFAH
ncbi:MAG: hypothetical protein LBU72_02095 [Burkholderiaceae bacterium]|jgi:hypothetical protein|nr:hypothetical protein [Burkholderiaceae bacterium]